MWTPQISCVAYVRALFSDKYFKKTHFSEADGSLSYEDFVSGYPVTDEKAARKGAGVQVLQRGGSKKVDHLLDTLVC